MSVAEDEQINQREKKDGARARAFLSATGRRTKLIGENSHSIITLVN
jgi:hypothetical protein